eukprot:4451177-Prymnesium_polylepis.1
MRSPSRAASCVSRGFALRQPGGEAGGARAKPIEAPQSDHVPVGGTVAGLIKSTSIAGLIKSSSRDGIVRLFKSAGAEHPHSFRDPASDLVATADAAGAIPRALDLQSSV